MARSSLEERRLDFEDILLPRRLARWALDSAEAMAVRWVPQVVGNDRSAQSDPSDQIP